MLFLINSADLFVNFHDFEGLKRPYGPDAF